MKKNLSICKIQLLLAFIFISGFTVAQIPQEKYQQYEYEKSVINSHDTLKIILKNPLQCPLRIWIHTDDQDLQHKLNSLSPVLLQSTSDTTLIFTNLRGPGRKFRFSSRLGSLLKKTENIGLDLPFPTGREYLIMQGNNTDFTHNTEWSRYALDFNLKTNDTICSATDGYVVGVIDRYKLSGKGKEWQPFSNFLTIYDPDSGLFCQYVHLTQSGSLVKIGDHVKKGQKIALSGNTGQSTREHLHFSCLIPVNTEDGLKSVPITFANGLKGTALKKGDRVKNIRE